MWEISHRLKPLRLKEDTLKQNTKTHRLKAGIGAIFGFVMGLRVGEHLTKNPIGNLIFALGLATAAYFGIQGIWPDGKS